MILSLIIHQNLSFPATAIGSLIAFSAIALASGIEKSLT